MQLSLPDELGLVQQANAAGFASVVDYIRDLVERDRRRLAEESSTSEPRSRAREEWWNEQVRLLRGLARPGNPNVDDSRESIYRIEE